jgi:hypothetical protein
MRVNPNSEPTGIPGIPGRPPVQATRLGQDQVTLAGADQLNQALAQTTDVRPEKVAQAQDLIQNPSYPPEVLVQKIAALLAIKITPDNNA